MSIELRRLSPKDWQEYKSIRLESIQDSPEAFASTYEEIDNAMSENDWKDWLNAYILGAYDEGLLVGCATLLRNTSDRNNHIAHVYGVYVKQKYRGVGIGRMLLEKIITQAKELGIEILLLNCTITQTAAMGLYKNLGFVSYGQLPNSLRIGDKYYDQECMLLKLNR